MSTDGAALDALVRASARGDHRAFARIVDATGGLVSAIAIAIVRDVDAARDIAQEVFLAAWRDLGKLRNPASFLPWLRQTTRNRANDHLRTSLRHARVVAAAPDLLEAAIDRRPRADVGMLAAEEARTLAAALAELPDETREVVTLFYSEGRSAAQVGDLLGLSEDVVKKRLSRARAALRDSVRERLGETLRRSAPGAALTTAVAAALTAAAPAQASAATLAAAKAGAPGIVAKLAVLFMAAAPGAAGGLLGVTLGARKLMRQAADDEERAALRRFTVASSLWVLACCAAFPLSFQLTESPWSQVAVFGTFLTGLATLHLGWLPRIVARRHRAELQADVAAATARRRRERRAALLGWSLGILCGTAGLVAGIWLAGR